MPEETCFHCVDTVMATAILVAVVPVFTFRTARWFAVVVRGRRVMVAVSRRRGSPEMPGL